MAQTPDPRSVITPDAFSVDSALLGTPLSPPGRRFWALILDGLAVLMITASTSSFWYVLPFIIGFFFLSRSLQKGEGRFSGIRRFSFGCLGVLVLAISGTVMLGLSWLDTHDGGEQLVQDFFDPSDLEDLPGVNVVQAVPAEDSAAAIRIAQIPDDDERSSDSGFGPWLRGKLDTLSFGLGWWTMYFALLMPWMKGSTPGKRVMGIRVVRLDGQPITWWHAFERAGGYAAGLATGLLGFVQIYWDPNRQAIHDKVAGTVVILDGAQRVPGQWEHVVAAEDVRIKRWSGATDIPDAPAPQTDPDPTPQ
jgi:uncharacterized RDD family membrane protein YckC